MTEETIAVPTVKPDRAGDALPLAWRRIGAAAILVVALTLPFLVRNFVVFQLTMAMIYAIAILGRLNREQNMALLLVEQNAALALALADHAYLIETGRLVMSGPAREIGSDENVRRAYLGY